MKVLAFGASNSTNSINKQLAIYTAERVGGSELNIIDLNDFEVAIFSPERNTLSGVPEAIVQFVEHIQGADLIVISFAEYNSSYTAAFKNIFDWATQCKYELFKNKKLFLMATSPGTRGGLTVLESAVDRFPRHGGEIVGSFLFPEFYKNFDPEKGITDVDLLDSLQQKLKNIFLG